jgi:ABC-2 type transport system ATP-binding protein
VRDVFALCAEAGTTVLWATHLVAEVERAAHVVILHRGRVVAQGSPEALAAAAGAPTLEAAFLSIARRDAAEAADACG